MEEGDGTKALNMQKWHLKASTLSCNHFGRYGEWKKYLATKLLTKASNGRPTG